MRNQGLGGDQISNKSPSDRNLSPFKSYAIPDSSTFRKVARKKSHPDGQDGSPENFKNEMKGRYKLENEITSE